MTYMTAVGRCDMAARVSSSISLRMAFGSSRRRMPGESMIWHSWEMGKVFLEMMGFGFGGVMAMLTSLWSLMPSSSSIIVNEPVPSSSSSTLSSSSSSSSLFSNTNNEQQSSTSYNLMREREREFELAGNFERTFGIQAALLLASLAFVVSVGLMGGITDGSDRNFGGADDDVDEMANAYGRFVRTDDAAEAAMMIRGQSSSTAQVQGSEWL
mmetsp:Transcript_34159/g.73939  ORF Transcript_34159/g.73939 Transcript_34159/m.73939 type:complete len:212 (+) Transcript_34159:530-1165(+)